MKSRRLMPPPKIVEGHCTGPAKEAGRVWLTFSECPLWVISRDIRRQLGNVRFTRKPDMVAHPNVR